VVQKAEQTRMIEEKYVHHKVRGGCFMLDRNQNNRELLAPSKELKEKKNPRKETSSSDK